MPDTDEDMTDVSMELHNNIGMESFASDGPGAFQMETAPVDRTELIPQGDQVPAEDAPATPGGSESNPPVSSPGQSPHVRRKSALPLDPQVLRDLQAHRSLEGTTLGTRLGSSPSS